MVTLTAFADEISDDLQQQLDVLNSERISHIEFRGVWNKNVLDLTNEELKKVRNTLDSQGFQVSAIGSPIGKISIKDNFDDHLNKLDRAIEAAHYFDSKYIRIFSFFIPTGENPEIYTNEVINRMKVMADRAKKAGIVLLHENEKEIYGDVAERCLHIMEECSSENLKFAFDPANFVQCGVKPYSEAFSVLKPYIEYVHIKDAMFAEKNVVPAGDGDGEVRQILSDLFASGYNGFLSLEPHLANAEKYKGFSGPNLFQVAAKALKDLLGQLEMEWK